MSEKIVVVALGHRALGTTLPEQKVATKAAAKAIADLVEEGAKVVISHSNGPQIGMIHTAMNEFGKTHPDYTFAPMSVCSAMSQGYIGYHMQQGLEKVLRARKNGKRVVTVVTQVVVDKDDPKFKAPSKPIGPFYTEDEARKLEAEKGYTMKEDAGRGWRRVVASPMPVEIVELDAVKCLMNGGFIAITVGGGGIPVIKDENGNYIGTAAVIDKDLASERLAEDIDADALVILTAVEQVCINFGKPEQKSLATMTVEEARRYMAEGHFAPGSMLPKVEAAVKFVESKPGRKAIITSLDKAVEALEGKAGTTVC